MAETTGAFDGGARGACSGLMEGTRVATGIGWRAVEGLAEGDMVLTFDAGLQRITKVTRQVVWDGSGACPERFWPLSVPAEALGNRVALTLLPAQYLMIESDAGEDLFGDPFSLIAAESLNGVNGIKPDVPKHGLEAVVLHFETDQIVFAENGVLYYCPSARGLLEQAVSSHARPPYKALTQADADVLVMCIQSECDGGQIWAASEAAAHSFATA